MYMSNTLKCFNESPVRASTKMITGRDLVADDLEIVDVTDGEASRHPGKLFAKPLTPMIPFYRVHDMIPTNCFWRFT